jgi:hypothetical protein
VEVAPERLERWLDGFRRRHGDIAVNPTGEVLMLAAFDGAVAELHPPPGAVGGADLAEFVADVQVPRRVGLLLARKSAAAMAVACGEQLERSKVDSWYVQSRTAAGGTSQQRFARRRTNQAAAAAAKAVEIAMRVLLPSAGELCAVITGGDRRTVETILSDARLAPLAGLRAERRLEAATPNLSVLRAVARDARAVAIHLPPHGDHGESARR